MGNIAVLESVPGGGICFAKTRLLIGAFRLLYLAGFLGVFYELLYDSLQVFVILCLPLPFLH